MHAVGPDIMFPDVANERVGEFPDLGKRSSMGERLVDRLIATRPRS